MTLRFLSGATALLTAWTVLAAELPPIRADEAVERPRVQSTGDFLVIEAPGENNALDTPRGTTASRLSVSGRVYRWTPSDDTSRVTGGAALFDAVQSPDESFLLLGERVGAADGPNSSRLIGFNLFNKKLASGITLPERKLGSLRFLPSGTTLLAVEKAQPQLARPDRLLLIDLAAGKTVAESEALDRPVAAAETNGKKCWFTLEGANQFHSLGLQEFGASPKTAQTLVKGGKLLLSPDGSTLAIYGSGQLEIYDVGAEPPRLLRAMPLPEGFTPDWGLALSEKLDELLLVESGRNAWLVSGKSLRPLAEKSGQAGCYDFSDRRLLLTLAADETIGLYQLPAATAPSMMVSPRRLKPFNRNDNFRLFNRSGKEPQAILVDHRGNVSILEIRPRRWKKTPVYQIP
ncbi:hypothetical protein [Victivallis vadensis]|uniref:hypothetical protein n=1 Tax=Victivallis vadensis TaxID=172901 RepID=UPI0025923A9D|nr:hypothetical protein [Victivallis vadensis]